MEDTFWTSRENLLVTTHMPLSWFLPTDLKPEPNDQVLVYDMDRGPVVANWTGEKWVASVDDEIVLVPALLFPIPTCGYLPTVATPEAWAAAAQIRNEPPMPRRQVATEAHLAKINEIVGRAA